MPVIYDVTVKTSRMTAVRDAVNSGTLQVGTAAMAVVLADLVLDAASGTIATDTLTFSGFPKTDSAANANGRALAARVRNSSNADRITGLTVGLNAAAAPAWVASTAYTVGQTRTNGANIYRVTLAGTSASSGGPTGTGASIVDGTVTWEWYCVANADVRMDSIDLTAGQSFTINSFTIQHAA